MSTDEETGKENGDRVLFEARGKLFCTEKLLSRPKTFKFKSCGSGLFRIAFHSNTYYTDNTGSANANPNRTASQTGNPNWRPGAGVNVGTGAEAEAKGSASSGATGVNGEERPFVQVGGVRLLMYCEPNNALALNQWLLRASRFELHPYDSSAVLL